MKIGSLAKLKYKRRTLQLCLNSKIIPSDSLVVYLGEEGNFTHLLHMDNGGWVRTSYFDLVPFREQQEGK